MSDALTEFSPDRWAPPDSLMKAARDPKFIKHWRDCALPQCLRPDDVRDELVIASRVEVLLADEVLRLRGLVEAAMRTRFPNAIRFHLDDQFDMDTLAPGEEVSAFPPYGWVVQAGGAT